MNAPFRFHSVCSGIEAASVAWEHVGWRAAAFAEIDPFLCAVLADWQRASGLIHIPNAMHWIGERISLVEGLE